MFCSGPARKKKVVRKTRDSSPPGLAGLSGKKNRPVDENTGDNRLAQLGAADELPAQPEKSVKQPAHGGGSDEHRGEPGPGERGMPVKRPAQLGKIAKKPSCHSGESKYSFSPLVVLTIHFWSHKMATAFY
jgi:hypothetical protein